MRPLAPPAPTSFQLVVLGALQQPRISTGPGFRGWLNPQLGAPLTSPAAEPLNCLKSEKKQLTGSALVAT